ncbi:MAG: LacI family DNA-binding transcriptional regulator [Desulfobacteraceae bacterium]|jgi:DNA-binding LacI/PurR family transcriptional regulator
MNRSQPYRITIKDVARACGVSNQTVSRVINQRADVSVATREKVLAAVEQMGFQPSAFARGMRQQSTTLGIILAGLEHKGISICLQGITQEAERHGLNLILKELPSFDSLEMNPLIQSLISHQVMGIIYAAPEVGSNWTKAQAKLPSFCPPMIFLKGSPSSAPITISIDNYQGALQITRHLIRKGYRNIAHISGPLDWFEARERKKGWAQALVDAGMTVQDNHWAEGRWNSDSGLRAFERIYARYPKVDAVFAANDQMALAVLNAAWTHGIHVPEELGVAGFDNIPESAYFIPPLTTVRQDLIKLGAMAVQKVLKLNNPSSNVLQDNDHTMIPTELIIRQSTQRR